jgi:hypothetical protein
VVLGVAIVVSSVLMYEDDWTAGKYDWKTFMFIPLAIVTTWGIWRGRPDD